jgi:hypothetical protein
MTIGTSTLRAFISYSTADRDFANRLCAELKKHAIEPFIDYASIRAGDDWMERLGSEVLNSNIVLLVVSPDSVQAKWVRREVTFAESNNIPVIPLMHRATKLPIWLSDTQFADFQTDFENGLQVLLLALQPEPAITLPAEAAPAAPKVEAAAPTPEIVATATGSVAPEVAPPEPEATEVAAVEASPLNSEQKLQQQAIASQLAKPLTAAEVEQARLTREQRIEQEKQRLAAEQRANPRKFFYDHTLGPLAYFTAFCLPAATGGIVGIVTQNTSWALISVGVLAPVLYLLGFRKATTFVGFVVFALIGAGAVFLLMRYIPSLNYNSAATSHLLYIGDRTVILGRQILTSLIIFPAVLLVSLALVYVEVTFPTMDLIESLITSPLVGLFAAFLLPAAIYNLLIIFNWGFGLTYNLSYNVLGLLVGYLPGLLGSIAAVLGIATITYAFREKSLIDSEAASIVQSAEWRERISASTFRTPIRPLS